MRRKRTEKTRIGAHEGSYTKSRYLIDELGPSKRQQSTESAKPNKLNEGTRDCATRSTNWPAPKNGTKRNQQVKRKQHKQPYAENVLSKDEHEGELAAPTVSVHMSPIEQTDYRKQQYRR